MLEEVDADHAKEADSDSDSDADVRGSPVDNGG